MIAYNCTECQDTGKRILPNGEHSNCLDCSCEATTERAAMDLAAMDYIQAYQGDLQHAPEDVRWFVHQRASQMEREAQAARIAELETLYQEAFSNNRTARQRIYELEHAAPSAPAIEQQPVAPWQPKLLCGPRQNMFWGGNKCTAEEEAAKPLLALISYDDYKKACSLIASSPSRTSVDLLECGTCGGQVIAPAAPQAADTDKVREALASIGAARIDAVWEAMPGGLNGFLKQFGYQQFAYAILDLASDVIEIEARKSANMAAQAPVREVPGWQPIETAPKDGTDVILSFPSLFNGVVTIGSWTEDKYAKKPRPYWTHDRERTFGTLETRANPPTLWQPLPAAPAHQEG